MKERLLSMIEKFDTSITVHQELTLVRDNRHLVCIPYSIDNLHEMAKHLSIKRSWFHKNHYDIPKRRCSEIYAKCFKASPKQIVRIINGEGSKVLIEIMEKH